MRARRRPRNVSTLASATPPSSSAVTSVASEFETDDEEGEGEGGGAGEGEGDMDDFLMFEQEDREAEDPTHTFFKTKTVHIRRPRRQPRKGEGGLQRVSRTVRD